jgi:hypothetical protein
LFNCGPVVLAMILIMAAFGSTIVGTIVALFEARAALDRRRRKKQASTP